MGFWNVNVDWMWKVNSTTIYTICLAPPIIPISPVLKETYAASHSLKMAPRLSLIQSDGLHLFRTSPRKNPSGGTLTNGPFLCWNLGNRLIPSTAYILITMRHLLGCFNWKHGPVIAYLVICFIIHMAGGDPVIPTLGVRDKRYHPTETVGYILHDHNIESNSLAPMPICSNLSSRLS